MTDAELDALSADDDVDDAALAALLAPSPGTPPPPRLGMGDDGVFRATVDQIRDPLFCYSPEYAAAARKGIVEIVSPPPQGMPRVPTVPETVPAAPSSPTAVDGRLVVTRDQQRDPNICLGPAYTRALTTGLLDVID